MTSVLPPLVDDLETDDDARIARASARIRGYCGWHVAPLISSTVTLDADGGRLLMLPTMRLVDVVSVVLADGTVLAPTVDYTWSEAGILCRSLGRAWGPGFRSVTVVFEHGHEQIPDELADVCAALASRGPAQSAGVTQESAGGVTRVYGGLLSSSGGLQAAWLASEQEVLNRYRLPNLP